MTVLAFTDLIKGNGSLAAALETVHRIISKFPVFLAYSAINSFSPKPEAAGFQLLSH